MSAAVASLGMVLGAVVLTALATWGRRNARLLVTPRSTEEERRRQERVLLRGAWTCYVIAGLFLLAAIGTLL